MQFLDGCCAFLLTNKIPEWITTLELRKVSYFASLQLPLLEGFKIFNWKQQKMWRISRESRNLLCCWAPTSLSWVVRWNSRKAIKIVAREKWVIKVRKTSIASFPIKACSSRVVRWKPNTKIDKKRKASNERRLWSFPRSIHFHVNHCLPLWHWHWKSCHKILIFRFVCLIPALFVAFENVENFPPFGFSPLNIQIWLPQSQSIELFAL